MVVIIGGVGTAWGPVIGSVSILLEQMLRGQMGATYAPVTNVIFGIILIIFMLVCPKGVMGMIENRKNKKKTSPGNPEAIEEI